MLSSHIARRMAGLFGPSRLETENARLRAQVRGLVKALADQWGKAADDFHAAYTLGRRDERGACTWRIVVNGDVAIKATAAYADLVYEVWTRRPETRTCALEQYDGGAWRVVRAAMREVNE